MNMLTTSRRALRHATTTASAFAAVACLLAMLPLHAQTRETDSKELMTKEQQQQLRRVLQSADAKIAAGFAGQERLKEEMQNQLKAIENIKDPGARSKAIAAFQDKYKQRYAELLQQSDVDLRSLANQLQPLFPHLILQATDRLTIVGRPRNSSPPARQQVRPVSNTTTHNVEPKEFQFNQSRSCSLAAGAEVTSSDKSLASSTSSIVAGGCSASGTKTAKVQLPAQRRSATVRVGGDLAAEVLAVGVVGGAVSLSSASIEVSCRSEVKRSNANVLAMAMFAWVSSDVEQQSDVDLSVTAPSEVTDCKIDLRSSSTTLAEFGSSSSKSSVRQLKATVVIEP